MECEIRGNFFTFCFICFLYHHHFHLGKQKSKTFQGYLIIIKTFTRNITFIQLSAWCFRAGLVPLFEWVTMVMKLSLKFCSLCRSISSAHRTKCPFCSLSSSQGARLSSLYLHLMVRELEWMLQTIESGKPTQTMWTQRWGQLVSLSPTKKDSYLLLFEISSFGIPRPRCLPGYKSSQNTTALSKKLPFLRALPFHLPYFFLPLSLSFPCSSVAKNLPAMQETQVWFLSREDFLEKEMATHCSILA